MMISEGRGIASGKKVCSVEECERVALRTSTRCYIHAGMRTRGKKNKIESPDACVYFVMAVGTGLVKIGYSTNLKSRMISMQTDSPVDLILLGKLQCGIKMEKELHRYFAKDRVRGEWFTLSDRLQEFIVRSLPKGAAESLLEITEWKML